MCKIFMARTKRQTISNYTGPPRVVPNRVGSSNIIETRAPSSTSHTKARKLNAGDVHSQNLIIDSPKDCNDIVEVTPTKSIVDLNFNCPEHWGSKRLKNYCLDKSKPCFLAIFLRDRSIEWSSEYQKICKTYLKQDVPKEYLQVRNFNNTC